MVNVTAAKEMEGIIFTAHIGEGRDRIPVQIFVEGQEKPVGTVWLHPWEGGGIPGAEGLFDKAFRVWVTSGFFRKTVEDADLLSILTSAQRERLENVPWYQMTFRFLPAEGSTCQNPRFVLTKDKSDIRGRYQR